MVRGGMADEGNDDSVLIRPNRSKASSKTTKAIVVLLLVVSIVLMAIVTIGGWSKLSGERPVLIALMVVYLILAVQVLRWSRGALPMSATMAIIVGIFAAVSITGWFDRTSFGYSTPNTIFGGTGLPADFLGLITGIIVPIQILLLAFAMQGFSQEWQEEIEVSREEARRRGDLAAA